MANLCPTSIASPTSEPDAKIVHFTSSPVLKISYAPCFDKFSLFNSLRIGDTFCLVKAITLGVS